MNKILFIAQMLLLLLQSNAWAQKKEFNSISEAIKKRKKAYHLNLSEQDLSSLDKNVAKLKKLTVLDLSNNRFSKLDGCICELKNLKELWLGNNRIKELPTCIANLKSLKLISLSGNPLKHLPSQLPYTEALYLGGIELDVDKLLRNTKFLRLKDLTIHDSPELTRFPKSMGSLDSLESLSLVNIPKLDLDEIIQRMNNIKLKSLRLNSNNIQVLPTSIIKMETLEKLFLIGNPILELPTGFSEFKDLMIVVESPYAEKLMAKYPALNIHVVTPQNR